MSISLPTYTRREMPLLSRRHRTRAIITTSLRQEFKRPAALVTIGVGTAITVISSVVLVLFAPFLLGGQPLDLSFFFMTASNPAILFFVTLMAAVIGSGLIADDLQLMSLSLYLSRPITQADYLLAKAAILGALIAMVAILPIVLTPFLTAILGLMPWSVSIQAIGLSFGLGLLLTAFYTAVGLFLSSLTRRKSYAAAGVFAVTFGLTVPAEILASATQNPGLLYLSPWEDYLAVARSVFQASVGRIDWPGGLSILLGITVVASVLTYVRMKAVEVVAG